MDLKARELQLASPDPNYITGSAGGSTSLAPTQIVNLVAPPSSGKHTVVLPPVLAAAGRSYSVISDGDDDGTIEVKGAGDERTTFAPSELTAEGDRVLCYSDGINWYELSITATSGGE